MKKKTLIIFCFIGLFIIIYQTFQFIMIKSVENVKNDYFDVVKGKKKEEIDYGALMYFDYSDRFEIKTVDNLELEIEYVFHNNKKGYMDVRYRFKINRFEEISPAAGRTRAKFYIEKKESRWVVVKIEEQFGAVMAVYEVNEDGDITMSTRD